MFLGEEKSIKRNGGLEMVGRCSRDGRRCRWILDIYIYDARKISLDLDEFSIKKKSIDVIQNSNPAKSEERERAFVFYFVAEVDPRNTHKEVWLVETNYEEAVHRYFSFSRAWREVLARAGIHGPKLAD